MMYVMANTDRHTIPAIQLPPEVADIDEEVGIFIEKSMGPWIFKVPGELIRNSFYALGNWHITRMITTSRFDQVLYVNKTPWDYCPKRLADVFYRAWEDKTAGCYRRWIEEYLRRWPQGPDPLPTKDYSRFRSEVEI